MGHPTQVLAENHEQQKKAGIAVPVQEERPSTCQHVHQRLSRCLRRLKSQQCSGLTRKRSPAGRRQESSRRSGRSAVTAGTGRLRSAHFLRVSRSSARNETGPLPGAAEPGIAGAQSRVPACGRLSSSWGGRPRRPARRIGGRASRRCDDGHRSADVAGVDPASWRRVPGDRSYADSQFQDVGTSRPGGAGLSQSRR